MATATQPSAAQPNPLTELNNPAHSAIAPLESTVLERWHLLSLDAPTVAALWTWFLATASHLRLPLSATAAMAVAVWTLYAADRLLDSRPSNFAPGAHHAPHDLEPRHIFHHHHRRAFRITLLLASGALAALLPNLAPEAIRLYLILGALLLAYFVVIHIPSDPNRTTQRMPKELAVGVFFSAATFIPTVARQPGLRRELLPAALLFALLCSLNCLFIYAWEHPRQPGHPRHWAPGESPHPATALALRFLRPLTLLTAITASLLALSKCLPTAVSTQAYLPAPPSPICFAIATAALLLLLLDHFRTRFAPTSLRAAADLCLLTPILLLPFLR